MKAKRALLSIIVMAIFVSVFASPVLGVVSELISIPNSDFEKLEDDASSAVGELPYMWRSEQVSPGCSAELSTEMVYQGKYSLKLTDNTSSGQAIIASQYIPVEPGGEYFAGALIFHPEETKDKVFLYITWWTEDYQRVLPSAITQASKTDEWEEVMASGVAPENAKYLTIRFATGGKPEVTCYVDDVKLALIKR